MLEWIKKGFTCEDGSLDDARLAAFLMVMTFLGNSIVAVWMSPTHAFNAQDFGVGAGALSAGIGVWFGQRKSF